MAAIKAAVGSGKADDSTELARVFKLPAGQKEVKITLEGAYNVSHTVVCAVPAGVTVSISGAKDRWTTITAKGDLSAGIFRFTGQGSVSVSNLSFDASAVPIQFDCRDYKALRLANGIVAEGLASFSVKSCNFENIFGNGVHCAGIKNVLVSRTTFEKVGGHWYQNNDYDAFGDGVYISKTPEGGNAIVEYCDIRGYPHPQFPLSRIGVTFEFSDKPHVAQVYQCRISGYDRAIHVEEGPKSKIELAVQGCDISNYHVGLFLLSSGNFTVEDTVFHKNAEGDYNGQAGPVATWNSESANLTLSRCQVYVVQPQNSIVKCSATFSECLIDYGCFNWIFNNSTVNFNGCTFRNAGKGNNFYAGSAKFMKCHFVSPLGAVALFATGTAVQCVEQCRFENCGIQLTNCPTDTQLLNCSFHKADDATLPHFTSVWGCTLSEKGCTYNKSDVPRAQTRALP